MDVVIGVAAQYTIKPILHQLGYLFRYNGNIKEVENKLEALGTNKDRVHILVRQEKGKGNAIFDGVTKWLDNVKEVLDMAQQDVTPNPSCFNFVKRHQQSRKAQKRLENIVELINEGRQFNKDNISFPVPSPHTSSSTLPANYQIFKSRTLITEKIKEALANPNVDKVGVCGMGGVGKTTLLSEVKKLVLESNLFDRVIQVEVGQSKSVSKIQEEIGNQLNMQLNIQCEDVRSSRLHTQIVESKENILFMLDDLWKEYDVEKEFGIPCRSESRIEGCKILMTSRSQHTLNNQMNIEKLFDVNSLTEEESWNFFTAIVGKSIEDGYMQQMAKDIVQECGGLPIALKLLAIALKGKRVEIWKDAFKSLKNPVVVNIPGVSTKLYSCLQFSYDSIEDEAKSVLLLCSVFLDDYHINMEELQMYAMGMGLLNHINTWADVRNRVIKLVDDLKSSNLLLESHLEVGIFKMHDVVYDFAKYIASKTNVMSSLTYNCGQREWQEDDRHGSYNAIFVNCTEFPNLPRKLEFPNLQLLRLEIDYWSRSHIEIPITFFEVMEGLRVLDLKNLSFERPVMTSFIHSLNSVQTLCLECCGHIDMHMICHLKKLKILKIRECKVDMLPASLCELTELKLLYVLNCYDLKVVHSNTITNMTSLEELRLHSFTIDKLSKLDCLTRLFCLELDIKDVGILSNDLSTETARRLEEFHINVGYNNLESTRNTTTLALQLNSLIDSIPETLQILLQKCKNLFVRDSGDFINLLCKKDGNYGYPHLKKLKIDIDVIGYISPHLDLQVLFPQLMDLSIDGGNNLEILWCNNELTANPFCKLQNIIITSYNKLTYVFSSRVVKSLVFLHILEVQQCESVERIFEIEEQSSDVNQLVVPLRRLILNFLPKLKLVWDKDPASELLTFPNLKDVYVYNCPELKTLFPASFINHMKEIETLQVSEQNQIFSEDETLSLVSPKIVLFPKLQFSKVQCKMMKTRSFWLGPDSFPKLGCLYLTGSEDDDMVSFPLEMSEVLYRIELLEIKNAFKLVKVFQNGEENNKDLRNSSGGKLKRLTLNNLPNLTHVWDDNNGQMMSPSFDGLTYIDVTSCENLKCLLPSSITFFNLTNLSVQNCNGMMSLFSFSVAKTLVNLRFMYIQSCREMRYIVVAPEGEEEKGEEIIFNRLYYLRLFNLPSLTSFQFGKCMLKFLCLDQLSISGCSEMKTFSYGKVHTPMLSFLSIECRFVSRPYYDINIIIEGIGNDSIEASIEESIRKLFIEHQREENYGEDSQEDDEGDSRDNSGKDNGEDDEKDSEEDCVEHSEKNNEEDSEEDGGEDSDSLKRMRTNVDSEVFNVSTRLKKNS